MSRSMPEGDVVMCSLPGGPPVAWACAVKTRVSYYGLRGRSNGQNGSQVEGFSPTAAVGVQAGHRTRRKTCNAPVVARIS